MTIEEYRNQRDAIKRASKHQKRVAQMYLKDEFDRIDKRAKEHLEALRKQIEPAPRTNHVNHVKADMHNLIRRIDALVKEHKFDEAEFVVPQSEGDKMPYELHRGFDIGGGKVTLNYQLVIDLKNVK